MSSYPELPLDDQDVNDSAQQLRSTYPELDDNSQNVNDSAPQTQSSYPELPPINQDANDLAPQYQSTYANFPLVNQGVNVFVPQFHSAYANFSLVSQDVNASTPQFQSAYPAPSLNSQNVNPFLPQSQSTYPALGFISQVVNDAVQQFNDNDDEVTALINNHNGLTAFDSLPDPSVANPESIYTSFLPQDISEADLRRMASAAATAMGANQAGAGSAPSGPPPTSVAAPVSIPPAASLPVSAPAAAPLPTPVAPQVQGAGVPAPVTMRQRRVVDIADPYCCHLCFAVFTGPGGVRNHLMGATRGGGHAWTKQQVDNDALGRVPRTLGHFTAQGIDTRYTGTNPKQRNNRRRMAQGLDSSQPGYLRDVYGR